MCLLKDELRITRLDDNISYIEPTVNPLSANVVIINGKDAVWLYDVGSHPDIPDMLYDYITKSKVTVDDEVSLRKKKINIVLSHFHPDHTGNLMKICDKAGGCEVYQGRLTYKHTHIGNVVEEDIYVDDGELSLHIFPLPSSHAKGSLAMEVNNKYCFLGDGIYAMQKGSGQLYNAGLLREEIEVLKNVKADKFMCSHKTPFERPKKVVIGWLESIYNKREKDNPYISYGS